MNIEDSLKSMGLSLPETPMPVGAYLPALLHGNLLYLSGILPFRYGKLAKTGRVGREVTLEDAREEARQVVLNALSVAASALGGVNRIERCIKLTGYVASADNFYAQPQVLNGASEFLYELMGEMGRHCRSSVGVNVLPLNASIEIEFIFEIRIY